MIPTVTLPLKPDVLHGDTIPMQARATIAEVLAGGHEGKIAITDSELAAFHFLDDEDAIRMLNGPPDDIWISVIQAGIQWVAVAYWPVTTATELQHTP